MHAAPVGALRSSTVGSEQIAIVIEAAASFDQSGTFPGAAVLFSAFDEVIAAERYARHTTAEAIVAGQLGDVRVIVGYAARGNVLTRQRTVDVPVLVAYSRRTG